MKAAVVDRIGKRAQILKKEIEKPTVCDKGLLIKVHGCSLNPIDYKMKYGRLRPLTLFKQPYVVASDYCGEIVAFGSKISSYRVGDLVFGMINPLIKGTCADYVVVSPNEVCHKPNQMDTRSASALALAGLTAYQGLYHLAKIQNRERAKVLINGSSGGVGHIAVQLAVHAGAEVTAVCSERNREFVLSLGAHHLIDYEKERLFKGHVSYDIIFDVQGNLHYEVIKPYLVRDGCFLNTTPDASAICHNIISVGKSVFTRKKAKFVLAKANTKDLQALSTLVDAGHLKVAVEQSYSFEDVSEAFSRLETGRVRGKVVISLI